MKPLFLSLIVLAIALCSCRSGDINKRIDNLSARIDSLEEQTPWETAPYPGDRTYDFAWFELGKQTHQIIGGLFYVADIKTSFRENGYQVSGLIGNVSSMNIGGVIVECAIKDTTAKERIISGYSTVPTLLPGAKMDFSVFIPTTKTNVSEIGVSVKDYRM